MVRFLDDGRIEIDSNTVERSMRPVALNRTTALSADSHQAGANWALLGVAYRGLQAHLNPQAWLSDVLTKLVNNWPNSRLEDLMPWAWSARQTRQTVKPKAKGV